MTKQVEKRLDDLSEALKNKKARDDKAKFIVIRRLDGWTETHNLVTGEISRVYNHEYQQTT